MPSDSIAPSTADPTVPTSRGGFGRLIRSKWFVIIAAGVALLLIVTAVVVYIVRFDPFGTSAASPDSAPTGFPTSLAVTSSPVVTRGTTVHLRVQVSAPAAVTRVELWDGSNLYYSEVKPPQSTVKSGLKLVVLTLEYVPLLPGLHWLSARAYTAKKASISSPVSLPVRDLSPSGLITGGAVGAPTPSVQPQIPVQVHTAPGDTVKNVADRLGVGASQLAVPGLIGVPITPATVLPVGTLVITSLIATVIAHSLFGPKKNPPSKDPRLIIAVENCQTIAVITNAKSGDDWALYATSPLRPGYQRIGDVSDGTRFTTSDAPIGETSYIAYRLGTSNANVSPTMAPTAPVVGDVPDACADSGWTGTAKIVNGVLLTDQSIVNPYAYISVDQGGWQRIPADQGSFLTSGIANDVRAEVPQTKYDQLDIKMFGYQNGVATESGDGSFCRAKMTTPDPANSSVSGGACQPKGATANNGSSESTATKMVISATTTSKPEITINPDPTVSSSYAINSDVPVNIEAAMNGTDAAKLELQFSYFPIGSDSVSTNPPGVFLQYWMQTTSQPGNDVEAKITINPWQWKNSKVALADPFAVLPDGQQLSLDDQISIEIANARIAAGKDLLDSMYVRAVALDGYDNHTTGLASPNIRIDMSGVGQYTILPAPAIIGIPGVDFKTGDAEVHRQSCFTIDQYPDATEDPTSAAVAHGEFTDPTAAYCLADDYQYQQQQAAMGQDDGCGLGCFLTAIVIGVAVGVVTGGVGGALIGAAIAAGLSTIGGQIVAGLEQELEVFWNEIADAYNRAYQAVLTLAADLNPACLALKAFAGAKSGAATACDAITEAVTSAAITSVTGLPPGLPMSDTLKAVAAGKVGAIVTLAMNTGLGALGLSCDDFSLPSDDSGALQSLADNGGGATSKAVTAATDPQTGQISGCAAISNLVTGTMKSSMDNDYATIYSGLYGNVYLPPGLLVDPIAQSFPRIQITVPASDPAGPNACPVTLNLTAHIPRVDATGKLSAYAEYDFWPIQTQLTRVAKNEPWSTTISVPLMVGQEQPDLSLVKNHDGTTKQIGDGSSEFLRSTVDSPCFANSYQVNFSTSGSDWPASTVKAPTIIPVY